MTKALSVVSYRYVGWRGYIDLLIRKIHLDVVCIKEKVLFCKYQIKTLQPLWNGANFVNLEIGSNTFNFFLGGH